MRRALPCGGRGGGSRELRELLAMAAPPAESGVDLGSTTRLSPVRATLRQQSDLGSARVRGPEQQDLFDTKSLRYKISLDFRDKHRICADL